MSDGDRKQKRKAMTKDAWIASWSGDAIQDCVVIDISPGGARLWVKTASHTPDEFLLWLTPTGGVRRSCKVRWRTENDLGVQFLRERYSGDA